MFFLMNNLIALGSDNESQSLLGKQSHGELAEIFKLNDISYTEYDNFNSQLKTFFGLILLNLILIITQICL